MKPELQKIFNLFEELEVAGETVSLTISSKGGKSTIKLQLESPSSPSSTTTPTSPCPAASGAPVRRRRHRGARARAQRRQRAADHQGTTLADVSPPAPGEASAPAGPHPSPLRPPPSRPLHHLLSPSPTSGRRRVMSVGRPEMPNFSSLNMDGSCSPTPPPPPISPPPVAPLPSSPCEQEADTGGNQVQVEFRCDHCENTFKLEANLASHTVKAHDDWSLRWKLSRAGKTA